MKVKILPNHVTLFYERIKTNKSVSVNVSFARSFHECAPKPQGLQLPTQTAHLAEHLIMNNTTKTFSRLERKKQKNRFYNFNASTSCMYVSFYAQLSQDLIVDFLKFVADGITNLQFSEKEFANEKKVIENEKLGGPKSAKFSFLSVPELFPKDYVQQLADISNGDVQSISIQDVQTFMKETFVQPRLYIFISGNISARKIEAWLHKYFISKLPAEQPRERITYQEVVQQEKKNVSMIFCEHKRRSGYVFCEFTLPLLSRENVQEKCIEQLMNVLIKQEPSLFFREERGLCYTPRLEYVVYKHEVSLRLELETKFENIETIQKILPEFFARLFTKTFSNEEIVYAKQNIKSQKDAYVCTPYMRRYCFIESIKRNEIVPYYSNVMIYKSILQNVVKYVKICEERLANFANANVSMSVFAKTEAFENIADFKKRLRACIKAQKTSGIGE